MSVITATSHQIDLALAIRNAYSDGPERPYLWTCRVCNHTWPVDREDCLNCHMGIRPTASEWTRIHPDDEWAFRHGEQRQDAVGTLA